MRRARRVVAVALAVGVVGVAACAVLLPERFAFYRVAWGTGPGGSRGGGSAESSAPRPAAPSTLASVSAAAVSRGERVYRHHPCASCHEPRQAGSGVVTRPLAGLKKRYSAESLAAYLRTPNPPMPAFPLGDAERSDLAAYLLARNP